MSEEDNIKKPICVYKPLPGDLIQISSGAIKETPNVNVGDLLYIHPNSSIFSILPNNKKQEVAVIIEKSSMRKNYNALRKEYCTWKFKYKINIFRILRYLFVKWYWIRWM